MPHQEYDPELDRPDEMRSSLDEQPPAVEPWWRHRSVLTIGAIAIVALAGFATWALVGGAAA
jgi:hypothetical protein